MHPVLPKKISIGHEQCPARYTNSTFNIAPVQEGTKIVFNLILDGQPQQIALTLFDINGAIIFNVTIQPERVQFGPDYVCCKCTKQSIDKKTPNFFFHLR